MNYLSLCFKPQCWIRKVFNPTSLATQYGPVQGRWSFSFSPTQVVDGYNHTISPTLYFRTTSRGIPVIIELCRLFEAFRYSRAFPWALSNKARSVFMYSLSDMQKVWCDSLYWKSKGKRNSLPNENEECLVLSCGLIRYANISRGSYSSQVSWRSPAQWLSINVRLNLSIT